MPNNLETFKALWDDMDSTLKSYREEATALRDTPGEVQQNESLEDLHARVVATRRAQDRLEAILGNLGLVRARMRKVKSELADAYEDAWRNTMSKSMVGEYSSAKEKDATYTLGALNELVNLRKAERMLADIEEVYEFVNLKYRGLDSSRRDTETRIRLISFDNFVG